jgi:hypothetical protein
MMSWRNKKKNNKSQKIEIKQFFDGPYFFKNEIVTCINNDDIEFNFDGSDDDYNQWDDYGSTLELKDYKVSKFEKFEDRYKLYVTDLDGRSEDWYYPERFKSVRLERKEKLKKIAQYDK